MGKYCSEDVKGSMQFGKPLQGTTLSLGPGGEGIPETAKGKLGRQDTVPLGPGLTPAQGLLAEHLLYALYKSDMFPTLWGSQSNQGS